MNYGYRRVRAELKNQGYIVNKKKVQRIMQKFHLQVTSFTRKSRKHSTDRGKVGKIAPNRINRRFNSTVPHQKITTDTSGNSLVLTIYENVNSPNIIANI